MYPDSGYKTTHAQSVCTRPFSRGGGGGGGGGGPGDEAKSGSCTQNLIPTHPRIEFRPLQ